MKKLEIKTTTYDCGDGFRIDIVETDEEQEAWLYHKDYGVKELMFGVDKHLYRLDQFLDDHRVNADKERYISDHFD